MANDIRLLEDLVNKAVDQLKRLSRERDQLQAQVDRLREQLTDEQASPSQSDRAEAWDGERAQVAEALRDTLRELRGE
jgi:hypothetical protein